MQIISNLKTSALAIWALLPSVDLGDLQLVVGLGALTYGVSLLSAPAAWITFGVLLLAGWLVPRLPRSKKG